jgi:hypothetical protein
MQLLSEVYLIYKHFPEGSSMKKILIAAQFVFITAFSTPVSASEVPNNLPVNTYNCRKLVDVQRSAVGKMESNDYRGTVDSTNIIIENAYTCGVPLTYSVLATALLMKSIAEHQLSEGDSMTDMNQAVANLVQCQTAPSFYGTEYGAACETLEDYALKIKTNWLEGE